MPAYRIYWFDQDDHVTEADYLIADADDDVRGGAASYLEKASAVEVWHWARLVVRVEGAKPASPAAKSIVRSRPHSPLDYPLESRRHPFEFIAIGGSRSG